MKKFTNRRSLVELLAIAPIAMASSFLLTEIVKVETRSAVAWQEKVKIEDKFGAQKAVLSVDLAETSLRLNREKATLLTDASTKNRQATDVSFEICSESQTWERPSEAEQIRQLQSLPRYGSALNREPFKSLQQTFWNQNIFSFKSYGLSARQEPIYLSGLWTILESIWKCYDSNRIAKLNSGQTAEVWVLLHRVVSIKWTGDRYVMVVKPTTKGVQMIQFSRKERQASLPLQVITDTGKNLPVVERR